MPSWQQKSAKKGSKRYLMFGPNHILVTLRLDDHENAPWSRKCLLMVLKYIQIITGSVKTKKSCFSWKMFEINLNFQNWSKALCLGVSEPTKRLAAQSTAYTLCNRQDKQTFVKESKKKKI